MTRALDTNVIVRVIADPLSPQYQTAVALLESGFTISASVFMETEWVLRSVYRWPRARIAAAFRALADMPNFAATTNRLDWMIIKFEAGADFADMTHVALSSGADSFATFDVGLAIGAGPDTPVPIETLA